MKPESQDAIPGSNVVLKAAFTGTPSFTIKWFKEENEILTGGSCFIKKDSSSSSLALHSVKPSHSAKYTCQVANDAGRVSCTAVLFVKGASSYPLCFFMFLLLLCTVIVLPLLCMIIINMMLFSFFRASNVCDET